MDSLVMALLLVFSLKIGFAYTITITTENQNRRKRKHCSTVTRPPTPRDSGLGWATVQSVFKCIQYACVTTVDAQADAVAAKLWSGRVPHSMYQVPACLII
jgi:hypothetical protein